MSQQMHGKERYASRLGIRYDPPCNVSPPDKPAVDVKLASLFLELLWHNGVFR